MKREVEKLRFLVVTFLEAAPVKESLFYNSSVNFSMMGVE